MFQFGLGYKIKKFSDKEQKFTLGATEIDHDKTINDYFNGDILVISFVEAVLGILKQRKNIEAFLQENNIQSDIDAKSMLVKIAEILRKNNLVLEKIDSYIVVESIKMKPYYELIQENFVNILDTPKENILISATVADGIGPIGKGQAMEVMTLVVLKSNDL